MICATKNQDEEKPFWGDGIWDEIWVTRKRQTHLGEEYAKQRQQPLQRPLEEQAWVFQDIGRRPVGLACSRHKSKAVWAWGISSRSDNTGFYNPGQDVWFYSNRSHWMKWVV